jgi:hypothetical protein
MYGQLRHQHILPTASIRPSEQATFLCVRLNPLAPPCLPPNLPVVKPHSRSQRAKIQITLARDGLPKAYGRGQSRSLKIILNRSSHQIKGEIHHHSTNDKALRQESQPVSRVRKMREPRFATTLFLRQGEFLLISQPKTWWRRLACQAVMREVGPAHLPIL